MLWVREGEKKKGCWGWGFAGGEEIWSENRSRCYRSVQHQGGVFTMLWVCHLSSWSRASVSGPNPVRFQIELSKRCKDGPIWPLNRTRRRRLLPIWDLPRRRFPQMRNPTHWAVIVQWALPLIKHSSVQAIIHALTSVPQAVAMTTASAWSASYSQNDTWMTTSWIAETRRCR